ncbi:MAG: DnaJ C-terminal domain-containing protein [Cyanobacteria bacterium P01_E01_bin.35]
MSSTEFKDYYAILGVKKTAQTDEIKKQFRKLALKYHPDRNQGNKAAEAKFKEISEAYDVLSDDDKRSQYDRFGQYWQQSAATGNAGRQTCSSNHNSKVDFNSSDFSQYGNFEEFINELLGRFSSPGNGGTASQNYTQADRRQSQPQDSAKNSQQSTATSSEASLNLTLAEAFRGTTKRLVIAGETLEVRIPAGVKPGSRIRLAGKGPANSYGQSRGDLYLNVQLNHHPFFNFEGDNLVCEIPIAPDEAVLGASINVPTPEGKVSMKVPAGINSGQVLRLRGKGWSSPSGKRTDQLVKIIIATPQQVDPKTKGHYEKIRELRKENPRDELQKISL